MFSTGMLQFKHNRMRGLLKWLHTRNLLLPPSWKTYFLAVSYRFNEFFWSTGNDLLWAGIICFFDAGASWILRKSRNIKIFRRFRLSLLLYTQGAPTCSTRFSPFVVVILAEQWKWWSVHLIGFWKTRNRAVSTLNRLLMHT